MSQIDRQVAIDAITKWEKTCVWDDWCDDHRDESERYHIIPPSTVIRTLPSAQPEIIRGKWIYGEDEYGIDGYHCDQCGFFVPWDYAHKFINYIDDYNFCPHCGADMKGGTT